MSDALILHKNFFNAVICFGTVRCVCYLCIFMKCFLVLCSAFTAEQYQQHQQQLALMQKQQLAQIQQQQANSNSSTTTAQVRDLSVLWLSLIVSHQSSSLITNCCHRTLHLTSRKVAFAWIYIIAILYRV